MSFGEDAQLSVLGTWLQVLASQHCGNPVRGNKWFRITKK